MIIGQGRIGRMVSVELPLVYGQNNPAKHSLMQSNLKADFEKWKEDPVGWKRGWLGARLFRNGMCGRAG